MSLYTIIYGKNPSEKLLSLIDLSEDDFPRYRDIFLKDEGLDYSLYPDVFPTEESTDGCIFVYTRSGGNNRIDYEDDIIRLQKHPNFMIDYDDDDDQTYMLFVFRTPHTTKDLEYIIQ